MKRKKRKGTCYCCGSLDHWSKDCPQASCHLCGKRGHDLRTCPQRPPSPIDLGSFGDANCNGTGTGTADNDASVTQRRTTFTYVELFAGVGGFRIALDRLGGRCVFCSEIDRCARRSYAWNHQDVPAGDITDIPTSEIPSHDLLVGGFPCQPFSNAGQLEGLDDPRGQLFLEIVRILQGVQPKAFLLENVRGLLTHQKGATFYIISDELQACGYVVSHRVLDACHLVPQERKRLYIMGLRSDLVTPTTDPAPAENEGQSTLAPSWPTSIEFPNLPDVKRGGFDSIRERNLSPNVTQKLQLSPHQLEKVISQSYTQRYPDARFLLDGSCNTKTLQSSYTSYMVGSQFVSALADLTLDLSSTNVRKTKSCLQKDCRHEAAGPATASDKSSEPPTREFNRNLIGAHVWRRLSPREAARLQGFPETFRLCPERPYHLLGNAVVPAVIAMIAAPLLAFLGLLTENVSSNSSSRVSSAVPAGLQVTHHLLLEASPDDERRLELRALLEDDSQRCTT